MFGFGHLGDVPAAHPPRAGHGAAPAPAPQTPVPARAHRMSIVLFSGTVDKLMAASIMATGAAAMGMDVEIFLTTWGLLAFRKGAYRTNARVSADFAEYGPTMLEAMQVKKAPTWMENLQGAAEIGNVHVAACSMTMELYGLQLADLEPIVDEVTGVATFVERARESEVSLFI